MTGDGRRWPGVAQDCIHQGQAQNIYRSTDQQMLRDAPADITACDHLRPLWPSESRKRTSHAEGQAIEAVLRLTGT